MIIIYDDCTGANGTDVNGRTPDTTNTPGNTWVSAANTFETAGDGSFKTSGAGTAARIDTGVTDCSLTTTWNGNGAANRFSAFVRATADAIGSGNFDGYSVDAQVDADQFRVFKAVNGVNTQLGSTTAYSAFDNASDFAIGVQSQGSTHKVFIAGAEVFSASDASIDGVTVGGTHAHLFHGVFNSTGGRFKSVTVDNLVVVGMGLISSVLLMRRRIVG